MSTLRSSVSRIRATALAEVLTLVPLVLVAACVLTTTFPPLAFGEVERDGKNHLVITEAAVDFVNSRITILGENFLGEKGKRIPSVFLGRRFLPTVATERSRLCSP